MIGEVLNISDDDLLKAKPQKLKSKFVFFFLGVLGFCYDDHHISIVFISSYFHYSYSYFHYSYSYFYLDDSMIQVFRELWKFWKFLKIRFAFF